MQESTSRHVFRASCSNARALPAALCPSPLGEGGAVLWLWAWPELLGWPRPLVWLFSPVNERRWPGDLWGVDAHGELIIVEAKTCGPGSDPFEDFLGPRGTVPTTRADVIQAATLRRRWERLFAGELRFLKDWWPDVRCGEVLDGRYPGVVPYARHRGSVQAWSDLYARRIAPVLLGRNYANRVEEYLSARQRAGNPPAHFIGLLAVRPRSSPALSRRGVANAHVLQKRSQGRVTVLAIEGRPVGSRTRIVSRKLTPLKAERPQRRRRRRQGSGSV